MFISIQIYSILLTLYLIKTKKKIVIVTTVSETFVSILKDQPQFLSNYFEVHLITSIDTYFPRLNTNNITLHPLFMSRKISILYDFHSLYNMVHLIYRIKPTMIHSYTPKAGLLAMFASFICFVPVRIHTFTGLIFPIKKSFFKYILLTADYLISFFSSHTLAEGCGVKNDLLNYKITTKASIIGNGNIAGVDTSYYDPKYTYDSTLTDNTFSISDYRTSMHNFSYFGRLCRDKGISELIEAFSSIDNIDSNLFLFGALDRTDPISANTLKIINDHPRIHSIGFVHDVRYCMKYVDSVILPSYREGFPNVLLQAGSMKKLLIASDISGCNEIILDHETGFLIQPKSISSLRDIMKKVVLMKKEELVLIQNRCRSRISDLYDINNFRKSLLKFYNAVI